MIKRSILITGGAGFIGVNAAAAFAKRQWKVIVLDNLSREGSSKNLDRLNCHTSIDFLKADVSNVHAVEEAIRRLKPEVILHLAGQVAVTTSIENPLLDFRVNALGTLNVLESIRKYSPETFLINASTNKVYGTMADVETVELATRYAYKSLTSGVTETQSLELHSPYGCSKGVADQYTLDYARIFGINTVTLRQSCIYGPHQLGMEDQGWVSWFIIAAITNNPINIFGNGKQVRDILHVQDLVECYFKVIEHRDKSNGQAYNIGGGSKNTMSLLELLSMIKDNFKKLPALSWHPERPGDQIVYISNVDKAGRDLSWYPETGVEPGIQSLIAWIAQRDEHT